MNNEFTFSINFSGLTVRFILPTSLTLPECFTALMCDDTNNADAEYRVSLIDTPLCPEYPFVYDTGDTSVYETDTGCLRIYDPLTTEDGCQVACLLSKDGKNRMFYPASQWENYRKYWHVTHLLCGEKLLLWQNALLLHSSVVLANQKTILFSGASGDGKSTQAELWAKHKNADILNGDRCVLMKKEGAFYGGGSPWSGTSGIFRPEQAPIAAIFILKKSNVNRVRRLGFEAFVPLFSQTTINSWNKDFVKFASDFYDELLKEVPVYELECTPDEDAVDLAYSTIFGKENQNAC